MKKTITAVLVGGMLVATQAMATTQATARVGDRVGAQAGETSEFAGGFSPALIFFAVTIASFALITQVNDDSESD
ncbi:MAG: hypothetical protein M3Q74_10115 [Pseudomonadota bacterium]|nr:hypothetical protein [Pseudomonadota bacterium]